MSIPSFIFAILVAIIIALSVICIVLLHYLNDAYMEINEFKRKDLERDLTKKLNDPKSAEANIEKILKRWGAK